MFNGVKSDGVKSDGEKSDGEKSDAANWSYVRTGPENPQLNYRSIRPTGKRSRICETLRCTSDTACCSIVSCKAVNIREK